MKQARFLLNITAVSVLFLSCQRADEKGLNLSVNGVEYSSSVQTCDTLNLTKLSTTTEAEIRIKNYDDYDVITVDGRVIKDGEAFVPVCKIAKNHFLTLIATKGEKSDTLYLRTVHPDLPDIVIKGEASDGEFYLSFVNIRLIARFNNAGEYDFYDYEPIETVDTTKCPGWWDFKKHVINDTTYYSYHASDPDFYSMGFPGYNPGMRIIMDENFNPVDTLHLLASRGDTIKDGDPIDGHDFFMIDRNHYIMSSYIKTGDVYAAYLQEVNNGEVKFDWLSTDYNDMTNWLDPAFAPKPGEDQPDYVHFNSIDVLPDGNWLCSFRHISSILKINRADGSGDIMWRINGAGGNNLFSFHGQHYVRYHAENGTITLFNNGNGTGHTQMLRLNVNPDNGNVTKSTILHDDGYYTQACGALTFSGENMIVGWGIPGDTTNVNCDRILSEYNKTGTEVFSIRFNHNNSSNNMYLGSYRCVKCK